MKIRIDFVTNSSSSSYVTVNFSDSVLTKYLNENNMINIFDDIMNVFLEFESIIDAELEKSFSQSLINILENVLEKYINDEMSEYDFIDFTEDQLLDLIAFLESNKTIIDSEIKGDIESKASLDEDGFAYVQRLLYDNNRGKLVKWPCIDGWNLNKDGGYEKIQDFNGRLFDGKIQELREFAYQCIFDIIWDEEKLEKAIEKTGIVEEFKVDSLYGESQNDIANHCDNEAIKYLLDDMYDTFPELKTSKYRKDDSYEWIYKVIPSEFNGKKDFDDFCNWHITRYKRLKQLEDEYSVCVSNDVKKVEFENNGFVFETVLIDERNKFRMLVLNKGGIVQDKVSSKTKYYIFDDEYLDSDNFEKAIQYKLNKKDITIIPVCLFKKIIEDINFEIEKDINIVDDIVFKGKTFLTTSVGYETEVDVAKLVLSKNGVFKNNINKSLDYLIIPDDFIESGTSSKLEKAREYNASGSNIKIITLSFFRDIAKKK